jgi:hypothetical protein
MSPRSENLSEKSASKVHNFDSAPYSHGVSIFHLGNNSNSVSVLAELFATTDPKNNIVILHDLNLTDLFESFASQKSISSFTWRTVEENLGAYGVLNYHKLKSGKELLVKERTEIYELFLSLIKKRSYKQITHCTNLELLNALGVNQEQSMIRIDLPLQYVRASKSMDTNLEMGPARPMIILSGHYSNLKKMDIIISALPLVLAEVPNLRIQVVGGVSLAFRDILRKKKELRVLKKQTEYVQAESQNDWESCHSKGSLGIRLNVGINGESSGLVRDYLMYGMKVISDESSLDLQNNPNFTKVSSQIEYSELSKCIIQALSTPIVEDTSQNSNMTLIYKNLLVDLITEIVKK